MDTFRKSHIVLAVLAILAAAVLFITYGTTLPSAPFASIPLEGPSAVDSNGHMTVIADTESHRALILNEENALTGVVRCDTTESPFDAITDVSVSNDRVYIAGVRFAPDSDTIQKEVVASYDKGGNKQGIEFELQGTDDVSPAIKSLSNAQDGVVVSYWKDLENDAEKSGSSDDQSTAYNIVFQLVGSHEDKVLETITINEVATYDTAFSFSPKIQYTTLSVRGKLNDSLSEYDASVYQDHVFTAIDLDDASQTLFACDDTSGAVYAISEKPNDKDTAKSILEGTGYRSVHANGNVLSACNIKTNEAKLCDTSGAVHATLTSVTPSIGFSLRMLLVWASALYLVGLALFCAIRKVITLLRTGQTQAFGPMLLGAAVIVVIAIAIARLSYSSYRTTLDDRAKIINMAADHLGSISDTASADMELANNRKMLHGTYEQLEEALSHAFAAQTAALSIVSSANNNGIGMYCTLYGKDDKGIFYLYGSSNEYVLGTSANSSNNDSLAAAFENPEKENTELLRGHTLRDATQYRLVQIPTKDGKGVAGVLEVGSRMRTFQNAVAASQIQRVIALIVMILAAYLMYSELRACGHCLLVYQRHRRKDRYDAVAMLTRPFTLAITMLSSIDSFMTVLIARDLLKASGMTDTSQLLPIPAVMLGVGLIIGQALYGLLGARVGLRKLMSRGALVVMLCACFTIYTVITQNFWLYCAAKLTLAIPFGTLYTMGYSLPRLAKDDETRVIASGGVRRTDTSAATLGTILSGYAAQLLGNQWVYVLVAIACIPVFIMAINLLPKGIPPAEKIAQRGVHKGNIFEFIRSRPALCIALFIVLPTTIAAGYTSFLFPLFSTDHGLSKADANNIFAMGQLIVFVTIGIIERNEGRIGRWRHAFLAIGLLGAVFLLFSINATLAWSVAVIALVAFLGKSSDSWKGLWQQAAGAVDVPAGQAVGAMFAARSVCMVVQPFVMGALLNVADSVAVIILGVFCVLCSVLFFLFTRKTPLAEA